MQPDRLQMGSCRNGATCGVEGWSAFFAVPTGTGPPGGLRRVPFAAVAVKGLRYAAMNAQKACALDRRPRCGWLSVMRRMSSSHVSKNTCQDEWNSDGDEAEMSRVVRRMFEVSGRLRGGA
jgi:hypothetical protein